MKTKTLFTRFPAAILLLGLGLSSCDKMQRTETATKTSDGDTATVVRKETRVRTKGDDEVAEFKNWVNEKTTRADSNAKDKWPEVKEGFQKRSAQLDTRLDSFSAETRQEYEAAKARYQAWENRRDARTSQPLETGSLSLWRQKLLGDFSDLKTITAANAREAYLVFMGTVRSQKEKWSQNDWDHVDAVYGELNNRKREFESQLSAGDVVKIKTLQAEYLSLETAADARDAGRDMKK